MQAFKKHAIAIGLALAYPGASHAQLPSGGTVTAGRATVNQPNAHTQVIHQDTQKAVIDWKKFSIGAGHSVQVKQPGKGSILLNRVTGNESSTILGRLTANGQVFLVNPQGVYFGAGSSVDVGGLLASTLDISNKNFLSGNYLFRGDGNSATRREVINEGVLKARDGGYVVLAGDYAANRGIIQAQLGTAALASGNKLTLDIQGDELISLAVNEKTVAALSGVENAGKMVADGGRAIMTAATARKLAGTAVNNTGIVQAQSLEERDGAIYLSGSGGDTLSSGTLDARGKEEGSQGGTIQVLGDRVGLTGSARIDASGKAGGGQINIGGNFQGKGPLKNANDTYVGKDVDIRANATGKGDGGEVIVWANGSTRYYGSTEAKGGTKGGDGGMVEVSGKQKLAFDGTVDTTAPKGKTGTLLLDPTDIEIRSQIDEAIADMTTGTPFKDASDNGGTSYVKAGTINSALANSNVTVTTASKGSAPKSGTIQVDAGLSWSSQNTLTLKADNSININANISGGKGTLVLDAKNGGVQKKETTITANGLLVKGGGTWRLNGPDGNGYLTSYNKVNTLAADLQGTLHFSTGQNLNIGSVAGVDGIKAAGRYVFLYGDKNNAAVKVEKDVNAYSLYVRAKGGISQTTGGAITANYADFLEGPVNLTNSNNRISSIAADIKNTFTYATSGTLTVGGNYLKGIKTNDKNVSITTGDASGFDPSYMPGKIADKNGNTRNNPASLLLNETIDAGKGNITLRVGTGGVLQRADLDTAKQTPLENGSLKAGSLLLLGNNTNKVSPFVLNNTNNRVTTLAGRTNGSIYYAGGEVTIGDVSGTKGLVTTSNTQTAASYVDQKTGETIPATYNPNDISLSIGGNLTFKESIDATADKGSGAISIGVGGDFTAKMDNANAIIRGKSLAVVGNDSQGDFDLRTKVPVLSASGGRQMVINNSAHTDSLTALGIGTTATSVDVPDIPDVPETSGGQTVSSPDTPVGDFYLTTGGALRVVKINSKGNNLLLRSSSLDIVLDAETADNTRIFLQPYNTAATIGVHNANEPGFTPQINYSAGLLVKFKNPVATYYVGQAPRGVINDKNAPAAIKTEFTGDIHIGYDSARIPGQENSFNLGYRSLSAQTKGLMTVYGVGPLYNLRLSAQNITLHGFNTAGDQIHLLTNSLSMPSAASAYKNNNPSKLEVTLRTLDDHTIWVGKVASNAAYSAEKSVLPSNIVKFPDKSTIIVGGTEDFPFSSGGSGYGDIHIPWNDGTPSAMLGNRTLILSTNQDIMKNGAPHLKDYSGKRGGLWKGCKNLTVCQGTNPTEDGGTGIDPGLPSPPDGDTDPDITPPTENPGSCPGCNQPTPGNPYPPDTKQDGQDGKNPDNVPPSGDNDGGDGSGGNSKPGGNNPDNGPGDNAPKDNPPTGTDNDGGPNPGGNDNDPGAGPDGPGGQNPGGLDDDTGTGGNGPGGDGDGSGNTGTGDPGDGSGSQTDGDSGGGAGSGGTGDGDGGAGDGSGGDGDGNADGGAGGGGTGSGNDGDGGGGAGSGDPGDGSGSQSDGDGGGGAGSGGTGDGDGGAGDGSGGDGDGSADGGAGDGGAGSGNDGDGSGGAGSGDPGDGSGAQSDGDSGGGAGSGGTGDGDGGAGDGSGGDGNGSADGGDGSGGTGSDGDGDGAGSGSGGDGSDSSSDGDSGSGTGSGGDDDGASSDGDGGNGEGDGDDGSGTGSGANDDDGSGTGDGSDADGDGDSGSGTDSGGNGDGSDADGNGDTAGDGSGDGANDGSGNKGDGADGNADGDGDGGDSEGDGDGSGNASTDGIDLNCADVSGEKKHERDNKQDTRQQLVEVKNAGVKMRDPCDDKPDTPERKRKQGK